MTRNRSVNFTKKEIVYLISKTGAESPEEAMQIFVTAIESERIDPGKISLYIKKLMEKDGVK